MIVHPIKCDCHSCNGEMLEEIQRLKHVTTAEHSRRDFLKKISLSFAMAGSGLPLAASALNTSEGEKQSEEMFENRSVRGRQ